MGVNSKSEVVCGNQCQCNSNYKKDKVLSDNLFAPIKNKMKVLKKIKKRMGLGMFRKHNCNLIYHFSLQVFLVFVFIYYDYYLCSLFGHIILLFVLCLCFVKCLDCKNIIFVMCIIYSTKQSFVNPNLKTKRKKIHIYSILNIVNVLLLHLNDSLSVGT